MPPERKLLLRTVRECDTHVYVYIYVRTYVRTNARESMCEDTFMNHGYGKRGRRLIERERERMQQKLWMGQRVSVRAYFEITVTWNEQLRGSCAHPNENWDSIFLSLIFYLLLDLSSYLFENLCKPLKNRLIVLSLSTTYVHYTHIYI